MNAPERKDPPGASPNEHDGARVEPGEPDELLCLRCQVKGEPGNLPNPVGAGPYVDEVVEVLKEIRDTLRSERRELSTRAKARLVLGRDAVISLTRAAELLPWDDDETQWMVDAGITFKHGQYRYVLWSDVLDALPARDRPKKKPRRRTRTKGAGTGGQKVKASDLPRF